MDAHCGSVPKADGGQVLVLPRLFGHEPDPRRHPGHRRPERRSRAARARRDLMLGTLAGERRPEVPGALVLALTLAGPRPRLALRRAVGRVGDVAVAVAVLRAGRGGAVPVEAGARAHLLADDGVDHGERAHDVGVGGPERTEPRELEEALVDDDPLVGVGAAVAEVVGDRGVRVARLRQPDEVRLRVERAVRRHRPALDVALVVVGGGAVDPGTGGVAVLLRDRAGGRQARDLGGDRRWRVPGLLLPALVPERRPVRDDVVRGALDVLRCRRPCPSGRRCAPSGSGRRPRRAACRSCPARACR